MSARRTPRAIVGAVAAGVALGIVAAATPDPQGIVEFQPLRERSTMHLAAAGASPAGEVALVNLQPRVNAWFVLTVASGGGTTAYHLENAAPERQRVSLDADARGLRFEQDDRVARCTLWPVRGPGPLEAVRAPALPYVPLCDGRIFLRRSVHGSRSSLEATAEFLRDHVWRGEQIVGFVRREVLQDAYVERGQAASAPAADSVPAGVAAEAPLPPAVFAAEATRAVVPSHLGLALAAPAGALELGRWYALAAAPGVYASVTQPVAASSAALAYLVAFDLARFDVGFALGTDHPRLGWSARVPQSQRDAALPGPDGFDSAAPLARTGVLAPPLVARAVATFAGGFKREHGAFRYGSLAQRNHGSHYGFAEHGVVFSRLQPGLATLVVAVDGTVDLRTWIESDDPTAVRDARQNGVALVERGHAGGASHVGALVDQWGPGNWSGSSDEKLQSLRAGACLIEPDGRRFLVYGWFSSATPRTMAETFLAYGCSYAMHLDMNALEHTYLAVYSRRGDAIEVQHLVRGMAELDGRRGDMVVPRFVAQPDNRDFIYLLRREGAK